MSKFEYLIWRIVSYRECVVAPTYIFTSTKRKLRNNQRDGYSISLEITLTSLTNLLAIMK